MPANRTVTDTSPGPGSGSGTSVTLSISGPPNAETTTARTAAPLGLGLLTGSAYWVSCVRRQILQWFALWPMITGSASGRPGEGGLASRRSMDTSADIVVAGAGHNSLVAACYLAKAGYRCLVLDARHIPGGGAAPEER